MNKTSRQVIRYFYGLVFRQKPVYFVYMFFRILFECLVPFINIFLPKYLLDELIGGRNIHKILFLMAAIVFLNFLGKNLFAVTETGMKKIEDWFSQYFGSMIASQGMSLDFARLEDPQTLNQAKKAEEGMTWYSGGLNGLSFCFVYLISCVIVTVGSLSIIASVSWVLMLVVIVTVTLNTFLVSKMNNLQIKQFSESAPLKRAFSYISQELCDARYGKDIRMYGADRMLDQLGSDTLQDYCLSFQRLHDESQKYGIADAFVSVAKNIGIYVCIAFLAWNMKITLGSFYMLLNAANTFRDNLGYTLSAMMWLSQKANFMNEYKKFMEYENVMESGTKEVCLDKSPKIKFKDVYFKYPHSENYILEGVSITIEPGEHLSLVGVNGAGKTTFIKLLCRFYDVTGGEILINDVNIKEYGREEYRKLLAVVFQDFKLFDAVIAENIQFGDWEKKDYRPDNADLLEKAAQESGLSEMLEHREGLDTRIYRHFDENGIMPSGGEEQKIAIARALYKDAPLVILDEPTAALDPMAEYEVYSHFDTLMGGRTAIYISHRLSSCRFCDKIAVMDGGIVAEYGTHAELLEADGLYARMFGAQAQYYMEER